MHMLDRCLLLQFCQPAPIVCNGQSTNTEAHKQDRVTTEAQGLTHVNAEQCRSPLALLPPLLTPPAAQQMPPQQWPYKMLLSGWHSQRCDLAAATQQHSRLIRGLLALQHSQGGVVCEKQCPSQQTSGDSEYGGSYSEVLGLYNSIVLGMWAYQKLSCSLMWYRACQFDSAAESLLLNHLLKQPPLGTIATCRCSMKHNTGSVFCAIMHTFSTIYYLQQKTPVGTQRVI